MKNSSFDNDSIYMKKEKDLLVTTENEICTAHNLSNEQEETNFSCGQSPSAMKRVLIADDSRFMRQYLTTILKKNGYLVVAEAADGEAAVELYQKHSPDMVILDITMPKKSGIESLREIKMLNKDAKVVICSSMGQKFFIQDAYDNGAVDFIVKPFTIETIVGTVKKVLA